MACADTLPKLDPELLQSRHVREIWNVIRNAAVEHYTTVWHGVVHATIDGISIVINSNTTEITVSVNGSRVFWWRNNRLWIYDPGAWIGRLSYAATKARGSYA